MNRDKPYLRYVFDVADTGVRRSSPELKPWEVTPENRSYVMEAMERTFGVAADGVLEAQLEDIALQPVEKTVIDRCVHQIYQRYFDDPKPENMPILEDLYHTRPHCSGFWQ